jgi:HPr kinase/phosphorylase
MTGAPNTLIHATTVALGDRGVLIIGASGSGKSGLALHLMAFGATLVADDQTDLTRDGDRLIACCPPVLRGLIEARGVGLLQADSQASCAVAFVVDMDRTETHRLPPVRTATLLGVSIPSVHKVEGSHFPAAIFQYLRGDRREA